jgi:DNA-binding PadR family transcriptional regulator
VSVSEQDLIELNTCACLATRRAGRAITRLYDRALADVGPSSLQRTLVRMKTAGWITMTPGETDRRTRALNLTPSGWTVLEEALPRWRRVQAAVSETLDDLDLDATFRRLEDLQDAAVDTFDSGDFLPIA